MTARLLLVTGCAGAMGVAVALAVPTPDIDAPNATEIVDVPARGELEPPAGDPALVALLSGIDFVPSQAALDQELGPTAETQLIALARTGTPSDDPGLRIRAYRALALYPGAEQDLRDAVDEHGAGSATLDNLYLRAAMDSLATVAGASAVSDILPHLEHASRDVRAAAARALSICGSESAIGALQVRLSVEPEEQVKVAISKAIRDLQGD